MAAMEVYTSQLDLQLELPRGRQKAETGWGEGAKPVCVCVMSGQLDHYTAALLILYMCIDATTETGDVINLCVCVCVCEEQHRVRWSF